MKTIKVIDLLNKIANGEVPKKIKVSNKFTYIHDGIDYKSDDGTYLFDSYIETTTEDMNIEIEILEEEKKIPEKIKSNGKEFYCDNIDSWIDKEKTSAYCEYLMNKYNDLIDYLKSKGE